MKSGTAFGLCLLNILKLKGICYHETDKERANSGRITNELSERQICQGTCYGCRITPSGELMVDPAEADVVTFIFKRFVEGDSLGRISGWQVCKKRKQANVSTVWIYLIFYRGTLRRRSALVDPN